MIDLSPIPVAQTYSQILEFYQDKSRFAQGYYQYNKDGNPGPWKNSHSYCVLGATCFFTDGFSHKAQCCLQRVSEHLYKNSIQHVNDSEGGYEKVLAALIFAKELWQDQEPTLDDLGISVSDLLEKRKRVSK